MNQRRPIPRTLPPSVGHPSRESHRDRRAAGVAKQLDGLVKLAMRGGDVMSEDQDAAKNDDGSSSAQCGQRSAMCEELTNAARRLAAGVTHMRCRSTLVASLGTFISGTGQDKRNPYELEFARGVPCSVEYLRCIADGVVGPHRYCRRDCHRSDRQIATAQQVGTGSSRKTRR